MTINTNRGSIDSQIKYISFLIRTSIDVKTSYGYFLYIDRDCVEVRTQNKVHFDDACWLNFTIRHHNQIELDDS